MEMIGERAQPPKENAAMAAQRQRFQDDNDMVAACISWADENTWFNPKFFHSLDAAIERYRGLTDNQRSALQRIMDKFEIKV